MRRPLSSLLVPCILIAASVAPAPASARPKAPKVSIWVLSGRADLVNDGSALVRIKPASVAGRVTVRLGRRDVTKEFAVRANGRLEGLVAGLKVGPNRLRARLPSGNGAAITLVNHPRGGPLFAGPQLQPWTCQEGAVDKQCSQPATYSYIYKSTDQTKSGFQEYDPKNPPTDVATTTTDNGVTVPFIVRVETGYIDRNQYRIGVLFQPGKRWTAFRQQEQWNRKLLVVGGAGCGVSYQVAEAPPVTGGSAIGDPAATALARGYMTMSTALDNSGSYCNVALQAESLVMTKEHLVETYGPLRFTLGHGCSGGSLMVHWVSNAYPGVFQGIVGGCSYVDAGTAAVQVIDDALLANYWQNPQAWAPGAAWTPEKMAAVLGTPYIASAWLYTGCLNVAGVTLAECQGLILPGAVPDRTCPGVSEEQRYDATNRPDGVRCSIIDLNINLLGPRQPHAWSKAEQAIGRGFAGVPLGNVGVQYGLQALEKGQITPTEFADLNADIGGVDIDVNFSQSRLVADRPALGNAYRTGIVNTASNLDRTPIIFCGKDDVGVVHDAFRPFALRARLDAEHGGHANQLIWDSKTTNGVSIADAESPLLTDCWADAFDAMDRWLTALHRGEDKPADLTDRCYDATSFTNGDVCPAGTNGAYGTPRMVAGEAIASDANQCRLKPLRRGDYKVTFTDADWAQLEKAFPDGVCDFSKPALGRQRTIPWLSYQTRAGQVIYGGRPLGPPPRSAASAPGVKSAHGVRHFPLAKGRE